MSIATPVRSDQDIQTAVQDELKWTPDVDAAGVGVAVEDGAVSLSGEVDDYSERLAAKRAALRIRGVTAVVDDLVVHPKSGWTVTETDIAKEVERALNWASNVTDTVKAEIKDHAVTLTGQVSWDFQRQAAKRAVQYLRGVNSVNNMITLTARPSAVDAEERIKNALTRNAQLDAKTIDATVSGNKVTLTGTVRSWAEKRQAGNAAWASPHVTDVDNRIVIRAN
ncbi:BON domain-containing protein [Glaciibacter superstes]|uniref:BON domain-containing protein n=1 Tax=Glaciibacter superstes TaxID=501023 RepID=UPI0003B661C6|nr:BON domain-containing protein [Glaciibacter superstes]